MIVWGGRNGSGNFDSGAIYAGTYPAASPGDSLRLARTTTVDLAWNASAGAISYNVKRCSGTCAPATVVATPAAAAYSEANNATTYFYAVEAVNACGATP